MQQTKTYNLDTKVSTESEVSAGLPVLKGVDVSAKASASLNYGMNSATTMTNENGQAITGTVPFDIFPGKNYILVSKQKFHVHHIPLLKWHQDGSVEEKEFVYETSDQFDVDYRWEEIEQGAGK